MGPFPGRGKEYENIHPVRIVDLVPAISSALTHIHSLAYSVDNTL